MEIPARRFFQRTEGAQRQPQSRKGLPRKSEKGERDVEKHRKDRAHVPAVHEEGKRPGLGFAGREFGDERLPDGIVAAQKKARDEPGCEERRECRKKFRVNGRKERRRRHREHGIDEKPAPSEAVCERAECDGARRKADEVEAREESDLPARHIGEERNDECGRSSGVAVEKRRPRARDCQT